MTRIKTVKPNYICWLKVRPGKKWKFKTQMTLEDFEK